MNSQAVTVRGYALERVLAVLAAAICLTLTVIIWASLSRQQEMWPLPALYFLEMIAASLVGLWGIYRHDTPGRLAAWASTGAVLGFAILGALSVGFFYLPVAGMLGLAALWQDRQDLRRLLPHLGLLLVVAVAQAALMLALIRVVYPSTAF